MRWPGIEPRADVLSTCARLLYFNSLRRFHCSLSFAEEMRWPGIEPGL